MLIINKKDLNMNGNKINQNNYPMNFKHSLSSAPISLKDIENIDIEDDDNDNETQSIKSYRTNISELTNTTKVVHNNNLYKNHNEMQKFNNNEMNQNNYENNQLVPKRMNNFRFADSGYSFDNNNNFSVANSRKVEYLSRQKDENFLEKNFNQQQIDLYQQQNHYNNINGYQDEEDDELREVLDETNPEFVDFKNNVREWLKLDDDIKTLQRAVAERRKKKNELTPNVLEFMGKYEIEDLNTHEGKVQYAKSMVTKPMNKDYLKLRLTEYLKSMDKAEKCTKFLMENRIKEERVRLKRVNPRKKQN